MADDRIEQLGGKTPLQAAKKPCIDYLAQHGTLGVVRTVPAGMKPGSDVANLSALGYDPKSCYTGRSPLEAVSMGIQMTDTDVALRCNLVTLSENGQYEDKVLEDYSSGEITTEEAAELIRAVEEALGTEGFSFHAGISYRHCLIWKQGKTELELTPPHDISDRVIGTYLPKEKCLQELMKRSYEVLKDHPINQKRRERGLHPATSIWLWGEGTRPKVTFFEALYGKKGSMISAVDLLKGIGISAGMQVIEVEGATGNKETNFRGKGEAALKTLLDGQDFVYIHVEAPDECGHQGDLEGKVYSIEQIDRQIVTPLLRGLKDAGEEFAILVMPDHPTPIAIKTHTSTPVPYLIYRSDRELASGAASFDEATAAAAGNVVEEGWKLIGQLFAEV